MAGGSWALAEELFARGEAAFVAELRRVHDADRLGNFAARWLADPRPAARQLLLDYLALPLNAYRHEALVKRLFKGAEKAGDDELMGAFLVAFDRSIRRKRKTITRHKWDRLPTREQAEARSREWESDGYSVGPISSSTIGPGNFSTASIDTAGNFVIPSSRTTFHIYASKQEEVIVTPANTMPRESPWWKNQPIPDYSRERLEKRFVLFSIPTRRYLRRRAWRYFRKLGKADPARYRTAAVAYLKRYTDGDVDTDIHLLDNWGLVHTLFFDSPALIRPAKGWEFAFFKTLADLAPAPRFPAAWTGAPEALFELLTAANCRTVRQWASWMLRKHQPDWLSRQPVTTLLTLVDHADPDVAALGFDLLERHADLAAVPVETWLARLGGDDLDRLQRLSSLLERRLDPGRVALADAVKLALHRSLPIARLGLALLRGRSAPDQTDVPALLPLVQAECEMLRPELVGWLRDTLARFGPPRAEWLLEFLDSKHADVRAIGWTWLRETPLRDEPAVWHKLLESPYDDIKGPLVAELTERSGGADFDAVRLLWASVLLNIHRGGRHKPGVVSQVVTRLVEHPDESDRLLPLLAVAVRSLRGPEFRAGLTGVVWLFDQNAALRPAIAKQFPELVVS
jgi:hypothetical protein